LGLGFRRPRWYAKVVGQLTGQYAVHDGVKLFHEGTNPLFTASVQPPHPGTKHVRWVWQRRDGSAWTTILDQTLTVSESSRGFFLTGTVKGKTYRIRALWLGDGDHLASTSPWFAFRITA